MLKNHDGFIEFARYAYFTLFAAKRAIKDKDFRDLIVNDLFYYEPVAVKLAALARTDEDLLERLAPLLAEGLDERVDQGSPYEILPLVEVTALPPAREEQEAEPTVTAVARTDHEDDDELEFPDPSATGSFGLVRSEMAVTARLYRTVRLASSLLRDLDQIEQLELKQAALVQTLELWGRFIAALSADESLADLRKAVTENLPDDDEDRNDADKERFIDFLVRSIPAGTALSGMEGTLVSTKLDAVLEKAFHAGQLTSSPERVTGALFFYYLQRPAGWVEKVRAILQDAADTWIVTQFFHALCQDLYAQGVGSDDDEDVMELCKDLATRGHSFVNADLREDYLNRYSKKLLTARARSKQTALGPAGAGE